MNGGFTINQRGYVSAAALASGAYGHDRWKAGAGGGNYSFTQLASDTTITIAANKTLIQVVEDKNVQATSYVLSWTGSALARYAVNSATPAGAYAASPILITGQTVGTTMSVEFGNGASAGTLGKVQLERASASAQATSFEQRPYGHELVMCQRYYEKSFPIATAPAQNAGLTGVYIWTCVQAGAVTQRAPSYSFKVTKRTTPTTITAYNPSAANAFVRDNSIGADFTSTAITALGDSGLTVSGASAASAAVNAQFAFHWSAECEL